MLCDDLEDGMGEAGGRCEREGIYTAGSRVVHQKPIQHCKAITVQLKIN